jgi:hypothetical protein
MNISQSPIVIKVPQDVLDWVDHSVEILHPENLAIARQINKLMHETDLSDKDFPLTLTYKNETVDLTYELFYRLKTNKFELFKKEGFTIWPKYDRIVLPYPVKQSIINALPSILHKHNPLPVLQIIEGQGMLTHTDYTRRTSLFYLLTEAEDWTTSWYLSKSNGHKEADELGFMWPHPKYEDITLDKAITIQKNTWYVFNNRQYHSVKHKSCGGIRKALQIEFNNLTAHQLYTLLSSYQQEHN